MKKNIKNLYLAVIILFLYLPVIFVILYSFNSSKSTTVWGGFTFNWYAKLFKNTAIMKSLYNSLFLGIAATLSAVVLGTLGSFGMSRFKSRLTKWFKPLVYLPVLTPEIIVGIAFLQIFSLLNMKFGMTTLFLSHFSFCVPFVMITVSSRLDAMDERLEEAARDLGASKWKAFFTVTLPSVMPAILSGAMLSFIMSFDDVVISFFMTGAESTTLPVKVYSMMKVGVSPEINALSTIIILVTGIIVCMINKKAKGGII